MLADFEPKDVVWEIEYLGKRPPWENNISSDITNLSNYFVTSNGRDLFALCKTLLINVKKGSISKMR